MSLNQFSSNPPPAPLLPNMLLNQSSPPRSPGASELNGVWPVPPANEEYGSPPPPTSELNGVEFEPPAKFGYDPLGRLPVEFGVRYLPSSPMIPSPAVPKARPPRSPSNALDSPEPMS